MTKKWMITGALLFAVGCDKKAETPAPVEKTSPQYDRMVQKTNAAVQTSKEAVEATKDYSFARKDEFVAKIEAQLADLRKEADALSAKSKSATGDAKVKATAELATLQQKADELSKQATQLKSATATTWDDTEAKAKNAYDSAQGSVTEARKWLATQIAP